MDLVLAFILGAVFSFVGSIPPGTLNLTVLQLGLQGKTAIALRFALAVTIVEYPYAWIAVEFESWITSRPVVTENFQLITAIVMTVIGILNLITANRPGGIAERFDNSGFRRGMILSILNPMAIPFWIAVTAYLKSNGWLKISEPLLLHGYVFGTSVGVMILLLLFIFLSRRFSGYAQGNIWVKRFPGIVLLVLGLYAFGKYLF
ncbi:MAG: LysE family translocator [Cyclobacteriaceae bacterium]|jgi:threonine/homoserine/homoserine lactone efflux protein